MKNLQPHMDRISDLATGFMRSHILFTANEAGVFPLLEEFCTSDEVAAALNWDARGARMLLDGLVALELVSKMDGRYRNSETASQCLVPGSPGYQGHYLRHLQGSRDSWDRLPEAVRIGDAVREKRPERTPQQLRNFILGMADLGRLSANQLADAVDLSPYQHLLDVGGGPGTYGIVFLERHPQMRATLADLPPVVELAKEQVAAAGMESRFSYIPGDFLESDFGKGCDLILVSNVIHMLGPDANRRLVKKCFDALEPGGLLIVKDFLPDEQRTGPAFSLVFALHMLVNSGAGDTYTPSEVGSWTREAGFEDAGVVAMTPRTSLWLARRPAARWV